ncbi:MAG: glycosyltransferase family A protein [Kineothrix sp.]|nr:glycosyltransferase family A protein [Kineothrix sp.]
MKYITFTVPCYNSAPYMRRCIDSLLPFRDYVEIIIINDGSTDATPEIADEYALRFPETVKVIHKANGGHGSGVNAGLAHASCKYFKVVDSDDWLDRRSLQKILLRMMHWEKQGKQADMIVCNYVYDHLYENKKKSMSYKNVFKEGKMLTWNDIGIFSPSQYLVMHSLIFRTEILKKSGVTLPEHTFYVDNIFAYRPLPYVESIYYLNTDLYHYFIGREDQSVNEEILKQRIDQQIFVTKIVAGCVDLEEVKEKYPKLARYMTRNVSIMMAISSIHLLLIGSEDAQKKRTDLWNYMKIHNKNLYQRLRYTTLSSFTNLPGKTGRFVTVTGYRAAKKIYQFN